MRRSPATIHRASSPSEPGTGAGLLARVARTGVGVLLAIACARLEPASSTAPRSEAPLPRRAPGVAVDPAVALPAPAAEAGTDRGLMVLSSPRDRGAARQVVARFFRAVLEESPDELAELLDERCTIRTDSAGNRAICRSLWPARFERLDYSALAGRAVFRARDVEIFEDPQTLAQAGRALPVQASHDDVVVRVPILASRSSKERLFGDEIWFVLKPGAKGYRIAEMIEEFTLP